MSSKSYSYICKNDIPNNKYKMKNNILYTKGIMNSYSQQYIDHNLFKETLLNNVNLKKFLSILFQYRINKFQLIK